jgi:hypothetical protein
MNDKDVQNAQHAFQTPLRAKAPPDSTVWAGGCALKHIAAR